MRVAFATTRGTTVDEHFGRAAKFAVYDVTPAAAEFVELREVAEGEFDLAVIETRGTGPAHEEALERKLERLADCRIVYFTEIGGPSAAKLVQRGIMPLKATDGSTIATLVESLADRAKDNPPPWMRKALEQDQQ